MITDVDALYFEWLMSQFENPFPGLKRVCRMLDENVFQRRVGNDMNRAIDGEGLRRHFLDDYNDADIDPRNTNDFLEKECTWFEMLFALALALDYLYDEGFDEHFLELITNMGLSGVLFRTDDKLDGPDQALVDAATNRVDHNMFGPDGQGGIFPLVMHDHPDQREVEIWDQHAAYFRERLEGVMWTSTN